MGIVDNGMIVNGEFANVRNSWSVTIGTTEDQKKHEEQKSSVNGMHKLSLTEDPTVGNNDEVDGDEIEVGNDIMDEYDYIASSSSDDESSGVESDNDETDFLDVKIPYKTVYMYGEESIKEYFLPGVPVRVKITECIFQPSSHRLNPNLYIIQVKHGKFKWTLEKRFKHFLNIRNHLDFHRAALVVKHPTMAGRLEKVPKLPMRPEVSLRSENSKTRRMRKLQKFLQCVLNIDKFRNYIHVLDFLGVSHLSFIEDLGAKQKECKVLKKSGGHTFRFGLIKKVNPAWHSRWLVLRNDFIAYVDKENNVVRDVLLFDEQFKVTCDQIETGIRKGLMISNNIRNLVVRFTSERQASLCLVNIVKLMGSHGSDWIRAHRYQSFAPIRRKNWIKCYVDGCDYFSDVADAIQKAKEEIFITDWWLSPELIMKRPTETHKWGLDVLLKERAEAGVKIFILLYKEIEMTLTINSSYTKKKLTSLHPENIKVIRHPDKVSSDNPVLYWAHHEKLVCIDQKITFMGGLDLCYGRWDDHTHRLTDFGSATPNFFRKTANAVVDCANIFLDSDAISTKYHKQQIETLASQSNFKWFIGKDYSNPYVKDIDEVDKPFIDLIDRSEIPRMPWHDIGCVLFGDAARDVGRHFIQRWNFTKQLKYKESIEIPFVLPKFKKGTCDDCHLEYNVTTAASVQVLRSASQWSTGLLSHECSIYEAYKDHIRSAKYYIYIENQFFITTKSRHIINEIGDLLVQRILTAFNNKETFRVYVVMPLLPAFPGEIGTPAATSTCFVEYWNLNSGRTIQEKLKENGVEDPAEYIGFYGLRNFANHRGRMISEIVYVHSKLMIVDDSVVIIGSANINDRSMLGSRDSELAVCVQDNVDMISGKMNGVDVKVGRFAATLRRKLFQEHLGLMNEPYYTVVDPISDHFYNNVWRVRAKKNSAIYDQVFGCLPTNNVKSYAEIEAYKKIQRLDKSDPAEARNLLNEIEGFIVEKPMDFLINQNLFPATDSKEGLVPIKVFT